MSEPTTVATGVEQLLEGLVHWTLHDDRIDYRSDAYGLRTPSGTIWIDPLPLQASAAAALGNVAAICLTAGQHQRSAWRYRRELGVPVYAPSGADLEEPPDRWVSDGALLPGGLRAIEAPASHASDLALLVETDGAVAVLFCGDAVVREDDGPLTLLSGKHVDDPARLRATVRRLVELAPRAVCPAHGRPWLSGGAEALHDALRRADPEAG